MAQRITQTKLGEIGQSYVPEINQSLYTPSVTSTTVTKPQVTKTNVVETPKFQTVLTPEQMAAGDKFTKQVDTDYAKAFSASNLNTPAPVIPPAPKDTTNYSGIITGGQAEIDSATQSRIAEQSRLDSINKGNENKALADYIKSASEDKAGSYETAYTSAEQALGIDAKKEQERIYTQELAQLEAKLKGITAESTAAQLAQEDRLADAGAIMGAQRDLERRAAIKSLPVQAEILMAQAKLTGSQTALKNAEEKLNTLFQIKSKDIENNYNYRKDIRDKVFEYATKKETKQLEADQKKDDRNFELQKLNITQMGNMRDEAIKNGQGALAVQISALDPKSPTFQNDLTKLAGKITSASTSIVGNGQYSQALSTILGSGKFTKNQTDMITNAIRNGEDPATVIKNQAKQLMTGTNQTKVENYEGAKYAMQGLQDALTKYYDLGGKTGLLSGNYEKVLNKLGTVSDPALVEVATQISSALQLYRNAVSGTAYSVQEGNEIATVFPGITKGEVLNNAIIKGRMMAFDSNIDGAYKSVLGSAYDLIKPKEDNKKDEQTGGGGLSIDEQYKKYQSGGSNNQSTSAPITSTQPATSTTAQKGYSSLQGLNYTKPTFNLNSFFK